MLELPARRISEYPKLRVDMRRSADYIRRSSQGSRPTSSQAMPLIRESKAPDRFPDFLRPQETGLVDQTGHPASVSTRALRSRMPPQSTAQAEQSQAPSRPQGSH